LPAREFNRYAQVITVACISHGRVVCFNCLQIKAFRVVADTAVTFAVILSSFLVGADADSGQNI